MTWQPIETAPTDGTEFLAYHPRYVTKFWVQNIRCNLKGFTHWMPLPEPPEVESNGQH